jgi:hypothetical protein
MTPFLRNNTYWYVFWGGSYYGVLRASHTRGKKIIQEGKKPKDLAIKITKEVLASTFRGHSLSLFIPAIHRPLSDSLHRIVGSQ